MTEQVFVMHLTNIGNQKTGEGNVEYVVGFTYAAICCAVGSYVVPVCIPHSNNFCVLICYHWEA